MRLRKSPLPPFFKGGINQFNVAIGSKGFWLRMLVTLAASFKLLAANVAALETVNMALSNKNFQMILYPIAQERDYMQEEGIDLRVILARAELSVQATMAGSFQFNMAGTMAVVNVMKGGAPFKVILATNDKVLSWILSKPEITSLKELKGKRVATSGVANVTLIMAKQVMQKTRYRSRSGYKFHQYQRRQQRRARFDGGSRRRRRRIDGGTLHRSSCRFQRIVVHRQRSEKFLGHDGHDRSIDSRKAEAGGRHDQGVAESAALHS